MAYRAKRKTFDIVIENLPIGVDQKEVSRRFTSFGEIQSLYVKSNSLGGTNVAIVKFLCEPDANKAVSECNGIQWAGNRVIVSRLTGKGSTERDCENRSRSTPNMSVRSSMRNRQTTQPDFGQSASFSGFQLRPFLAPAVTMPNPIGYKNSPIPKDYCVVCTVICSAVSFYCQLVERRSSYDDLSSEMQPMCSTLKRLNHAPDFGKIYAVVANDGLWYRCQIKTMKSHNEFVVHFIDSGNFEEVERVQLTELPDSFPLATLIPLAVKCELPNIFLNSSSDSNIREVVSFLKDNLVGQHLTITTVSPKESPVYVVSKCMWKGQDLLDLLAKKTFRHQDFQMNKMNPQNHFPNNAIPPKRPQPPPMQLPTVQTNKNQSSKSDISLNTKSPIRILARPPNHLISELTKLKASYASSVKEVQILQAKCEGLEKERGSKDLTMCNVFVKLDSIASHLQLVNSIRCNQSFDGDDLISEAFALLAMEWDPKWDQMESLLNAYEASLRDVRHCEVKEQLSELVMKKTNCYNALKDCLQQYMSQTEKETSVETLNKIISRLKEKENSSFDMKINKQPSSFKELQEEYCGQKSSREASLAKAREETNIRHAAFITSISKLQMSFPLTASSSEVSSCVSPPFVPLDESMKALDSSRATLQESLDAEVNLLYGSSNENKNSVISLLVTELQKVIVRNEDFSRTVDKVKDLVCTDIADHSSFIAKVIDIRKQIKAVKSKLRHKLVDKQDLEETDQQDDTVMKENKASIVELQTELHQLFVEEDQCLEVLVKCFETTIPELDLENPDLGLCKYSTSQGVWKQGWEPDHFTIEPSVNCLGTCYSSYFIKSPVVLKEFLLESEVKSNQLLQKVLDWRNLKSDHVVQVLAMFQKSSIQMWVMTARLPRLDESKEKATIGQQCALLVSVLEALDFLHSKHIIHGGLHPSTILLNQNNICLDFTFNAKIPSSDDNIEFQAPELLKGAQATKASDMFSFGSLILLILFPHLKFKNGIPSLQSSVENLKSSIEEQLLTSDYQLIKALVSDNIKKRPTASALLKAGFLKNIQPEAKDKPAPVPDYPPSSIATSTSIDSMLNRMCSLRQPLNSFATSVIKSNGTN